MGMLCHMKTFALSCCICLWSGLELVLWHWSKTGLLDLNASLLWHTFRSGMDTLLCQVGRKWKCSNGVRKGEIDLLYLYLSQTMWNHTKNQWKGSNSQLQYPVTYILLWKGGWFCLFTHFSAIKSPRRSRGLFIREMCKKSKSPPFSK